MDWLDEYMQEGAQRQGQEQVVPIQEAVTAAEPVQPTDWLDDFMETPAVEPVDDPTGKLPFDEWAKGLATGYIGAAELTGQLAYGAATFFPSIAIGTSQMIGEKMAQMVNKAYIVSQREPGIREAMQEDIKTPTQIRQAVDRAAGLLPGLIGEPKTKVAKHGMELADIFLSDVMFYYPKQADEKLSELGYPNLGFLVSSMGEILFAKIYHAGATEGIKGARKLSSTTSRFKKVVEDAKVAETPEQIKAVSRQVDKMLNKLEIKPEEQIVATRQKFKGQDVGSWAEERTRARGEEVKVVEDFEKTLVKDQLKKTFNLSDKEISEIIADARKVKVAKETARETEGQDVGSWMEERSRARGETPEIKPRHRMTLDEYVADERAFQIERGRSKEDAVKTVTRETEYDSHRRRLIRAVEDGEVVPKEILLDYADDPLLKEAYIEAKSAKPKVKPVEAPKERIEVEFRGMQKIGDEAFPIMEAKEGALKGGSVDYDPKLHTIINKAEFEKAGGKIPEKPSVQKPNIVEQYGKDVASEVSYGKTVAEDMGIYETIRSSIELKKPVGQTMKEIKSERYYKEDLGDFGYTEKDIRSAIRSIKVEEFGDQKVAGEITKRLKKEAADVKEVTRKTELRDQQIVRQQAVAKTKVEPVKEFPEKPDVVDLIEEPTIKGEPGPISRKKKIVKEDLRIEDFKNVLTASNKIESPLTLIAEKSTNKSYKIIASRILPMVKDIDLIVIESGKKIPGSVPSSMKISKGMFWQIKDRKTIFLKGDSFKNSGMSEKTLLHEAIHGATAKLITEGNLIKNRGTELHTAVQKLYKLQNNIVKHLDKKIESGKATKYEKDLNTMMAVSSSKEMVAYGLTDIKFQDMLKNISYKKVTLWNRFIETLSKILGIKDKTALAELVNVTDKILATAESKLKLPKTEAVKVEKVIVPEDIKRVDPERGRAPGVEAVPVKAKPKPDDITYEATKAKEPLLTPGGKVIKSGALARRQAKVHGLLGEVTKMPEGEGYYMKKSPKQAIAEFEMEKTMWENVLAEDVPKAPKGMFESLTEILDSERGSIVIEPEAVKRLHKLVKSGRASQKDLVESMQRKKIPDSQILKAFPNAFKKLPLKGESEWLKKGQDPNDLLPARLIRKGKGKKRPAPRVTRGDAHNVAMFDKNLKSPFFHENLRLSTSEGLFTKLGPKMKETFLYPMRAADKSAINFTTALVKESSMLKKTFKLGTRQKHAERIGIYEIAQQLDGKERLKAQGIKESQIPKKLTPKEQVVYDRFQTIYKRLYRLLNDAREKAGESKFPAVENYSAWFHDLTRALEIDRLSPLDSLMRLNNSVKMLKKIPSRIDRLGRTPGMKGHEKFRGGPETPGYLRLNTFDNFNAYAKIAGDTIHKGPVTAYLHELLLEKFGLAKNAPNTWRFLTEWLDYQKGRDPIMWIENPTTRRWIKEGSSNIAVSYISYVWSSVLNQVSSIPNTGMMIGYPRLIQGFAKTMLPHQFRRATRVSDVLITRSPETVLMEAGRPYPLFPGKAGRTVSDIWGKTKTIGTEPLSVVDNIVAHASWLGTEAKAKRIYKSSKTYKEMPEAERAKALQDFTKHYADDVVVEAQGSAARTERAPIQRTAEGAAATTLQTFVIANFDLLKRHMIGIGHPNLPKRVMVHRMMRYVMGYTAVAYAFDFMGMRSPNPRPVKAAKEALEEAGGVTDLEKYALTAKAVGKELIEFFPIYGGKFKYESEIGGVIVNELVKLGGGDITAIPRLQGLPGFNQMLKSYRASKKGGTSVDIVFGRYVEEPKKYSRRRSRIR